MDSAHCGLPETDRGDQKRLVLLQGFRVPPPRWPLEVPGFPAQEPRCSRLASSPGPQELRGGRELPPTAQAGHTEVIPETLWIRSAIVQLTSSESCSAP